MIASILEVLSRSRSNQNSNSLSATAEAHGLTRSHFLRVAAMGAVTAGFGLGSGKALAAASSKSIPPVTDIDKLYDAWQARFNAADVDGLVDLYVTDVTFINPQGKVINGKAGVRADFVEAFKLKPQLVLHDRKHIVYRDIALTTNRSTMTLPNPDGTKQTLQGGGIEVLQKQADGGWRFIVDDASRSAV
jgi:uncharacterized protein (TIGR02246 family)